MDLKDKIRSIEDYPQKGVVFRDITTLLKDAEGLKDAVDAITASLADVSFDLVLSPESRGFIFGMPVAYNMGKGFVPVRKAGKLPAETISKEYELEYGKATIEIHKDAIKPGQKVLIVDKVGMVFNENGWQSITEDYDDDCGCGHDHHHHHDQDCGCGHDHDHDHHHHH